MKVNDDAPVTSMEQLQKQPDSISYVPHEIEGECRINEIETVCFQQGKFVLFCILSVIFAGFPALIAYWYPILKRKLYYDASTLSRCTHFAITNYDNSLTIVPKEHKRLYISANRAQQLDYFINRYLTYAIRDGLAGVFVFNTAEMIPEIMNSKYRGYSQTDAVNLRAAYGPGAMILDKPGLCQLFFGEVVKPLYLFIVFSVILWATAAYYYYAGVIFITTAISVIINLYQVKMLNQKIFEMAYYEAQVEVLRDGTVREISSVEVVPGDVVFLKEPIKIPFEGLVLEGSGLINECALTGQSVPIIKKADFFSKYTEQPKNIDKAAQLFEGTNIIQMNYMKKMQAYQGYREKHGVPTVVTRTNFSTIKGQLIRLITFPKQKDNIFQRESTKFLIFLACLSILSYIILIIRLYPVVEPIDLFKKFLDLITITVPPGLPVSMTIGIIYAVQKLKGKQIFCVSPNKVISGGIVDWACFDKTGTLTEDFMDLFCLVPANKASFSDEIESATSAAINANTLLERNPNLYRVFSNMGSNHSIFKIERTKSLVGDPMEIKLFQFCEFSMNQSLADSDILFQFENKYGHSGTVLKRFEFDSDVQRMSVIVQSSHFSHPMDPKRFEVYVKGSPEIMAKIIASGSLPADYNEKLKNYASRGFRVLAIGSRVINDSSLSQIKNLKRQQIQSQLTFDGFQVFENKLKPATYDAIKTLKDADIGCVMITGDNPLTGSNIGFKCRISDLNKTSIILDYQGGNFVEQEFVYRDEDLGAEMLPSENDASNQIVLKLSGGEELGKTKKTVPSLTFTSTNSQSYAAAQVERARTNKIQYTMTGTLLNHLYSGDIKQFPSSLKDLIEYCTVFARSKPNDKAKVVSIYQEMGKTVSMCGDGANDCGALKQADVGLSLSPAEASISAPFTSKKPDISAVVELFKECRAGLATNFSLFNIMASYSLIQYTTTVIVQIYYAYPADLQYLYWDLGCNFFFFVTFGYTGTAQNLSKIRPKCSLFTVTNVVQMLWMFFVQLSGQVVVIALISGPYASNIDYFANGGLATNLIAYNVDLELVLNTPETNYLFMFTTFLYIGTVLGFTISSPWRKQFFTNIPFMIVLAICFTYNVLICLLPSARILDFKMSYSSDFQLNKVILGVALGYATFIFICQKLVFEPIVNWLNLNYSHKKWL